LKLVDPAKTWFVVMTFTGSEQDVADDLRKAGFHAYLPRRKEEVLNKHARTKRTIVRPLLPSYIFVAMPNNPTLRHFGRVSDIDGVIGFLKNQGEPVGIDAEIVADIEVREMNGEFDKKLDDSKDSAAAKFPVGSKAELTAGTFAMLIGTILKHEKTGRIKLEVDVYGKAFVVSSDADKLRPAA
jgi:transcription antitermination factor NusG